MSTTIEKHLEIKTYTHLGVNVRVKIDYEKGTISLLDQNDQPKQWLFAKRSIEYMQGWQNILDAMKHAIELATNDLSKHQKAAEKARIKREVEIARAVAEER